MSSGHGSAPGATLDGVKVADKNTGGKVSRGRHHFGTTSTATLLVDDGTAISGAGTGTLTVGPTARWMSSGHRSAPGATLDGVKVADKNAAGTRPASLRHAAARRRCWLTTARRSAAPAPAR